MYSFWVGENVDWRDVGAGGILALAILSVVFGFLLKFWKQKKNNHVGELPPSVWEAKITGILKTELEVFRETRAFDMTEIIQRELKPVIDSQQRAIDQQNRTLESIRDAVRELLIVMRELRGMPR